MPVPVQDQNRDLLAPRNAVEKMLGSDEANRRPKTLIKNARLAIALGVMRNHPARFQAICDKLNGRVPYDSFTVASWKELHQEWLEHFGSVEGFTMRVAVGMLERRVGENGQRKESSIGGPVEHD